MQDQPNATLFLSELRCAILSGIMIAQALKHSWSELLTLLIFSFYLCAR
jgi:hypothetical protein